MKKIVTYIHFGFLCFVVSFASLFCSTIYKYRIFCETEGQFVYVWSETKPTKCPNNTTDIINQTNISVVDQVSEDLISIKDEYVPTGHNFKTATRRIDVAAGPDVTTTVYFSWPFNISVMNVYFVTTSDHEGDILQIDVPFDRIVGYITANIESGATEIAVSQTVIDTIYVGYMFFLDDGTNFDDLGLVTAVDTENNIVTVENPTLHAFSAATPTYVKVTRRNIDFEIGCPHQYAIGMKTIQGSHLPANEPARVQYVNKSSTEKKFILIYEYLY